MYKVKPIYIPALLLIDLLGSILFFWTKLKKLPESVKKLLVIRVDHIGDVLLTTPALRALKQRFPTAEIHVLTRSFAQDVLKGNPNVDKIISFNPPWLSKTPPFSTKEEVKAMVKQLREEKYDLVFDFHSDPHNIFFGFELGSYFIGYGIRGFGFLLNKVVPYLRQKRHIIQRNLDLVRVLGAEIKDESLEFYPDLDEKKFANEIVRQNKLSKPVCINPGAGRPEKLWTREGWAVVADHSIEKYGVQIVFTGNEGEKSAVQQIIALMKYPDKTVNLCGKTTLGQLAAILQRCKLFLGTDTGPMHLARAMGTPLFALFGPEDPEIWGYQDEKATSLKSENLKSLRATDVIPLLKRFFMNESRGK